MKAVIDRIEDGEIAVIEIEGGGRMLIPVEQFKIDIHEGACLDIDFSIDSEREKQKRKKIRNLQEKLKNRSSRPEPEKNEDT